MAAHWFLSLIQLHIPIFVKWVNFVQPTFMQNVKLGYRAIIEVANAVCLLKETLSYRQSRTESSGFLVSGATPGKLWGHQISTAESCGSGCYLGS